jgi:hypothetical protein
METKTKRAPASSPRASKVNQQPQTAQAAETAEVDYSPRKMSPRETMIVSLRLAAAAGVVFALLWLAHVKLER